jgi:uncharacterized protein
LIVESGGHGLWPAADVGCYVAGLERVVRKLGMLPGGAPEPRPIRLLERHSWLRSEQAGFWYPAVAAGESVAAGQEVGRVKDFTGQMLQRAVADFPSRVLYLVTALAINPGDTLVHLGA